VAQVVEGAEWLGDPGVLQRRPQVGPDQLPPADLEWRVWLRRNLASYRAMAHRHPRAFPLLPARPLFTPAALEPIETMLGVLCRSGFSAVEALRLVRAVASYASGYCLAEITGFTFGGLPVLMDGETIAGAGVLSDSAAVGAAAQLDAGEEYSRGLDALLEGLSPAIARMGSPRSTIARCVTQAPDDSAVYLPSEKAQIRPRGRTAPRLP